MEGLGSLSPPSSETPGFRVTCIFFAPPQNCPELSNREAGTLKALMWEPD